MTSAVDDLSNIDIADPAIYESGVPHDRFRLLRDHEPVHWHPWPDRSTGFWAITRHADILEISRDTDTYSSAAEHVLLVDLDPDELEARRSLIETDPPEHTASETSRQLCVHSEEGCRRMSRRPAQSRRTYSTSSSQLAEAIS